MAHNTIDMVGQKYGRLTVLERAGVNRQRMATWRCRCDCGAEHTTAGAMLRAGHTLSCGCRRNDAAASRVLDASPQWRGDEVTYNGAHCRVRRQRGSASQHPCADCGGQAEQWSLRHGAGTKMGPNGKRPMRYSTDPADYDPRCRPCHRVYDEVAA